MLITQTSYLGPPRRSAPCRRCGRILTDPVSIVFEIGPRCRRFVPVEEPRKEPVVLDPKVVRQLHQPKPALAEPAPTPPAKPEEPEFLMWGYPDKSDKTSVPEQVFRDGVAFYGRRHGRAARVVLTNPAQATWIAEAADQLGIELRVAAFVPRGSYYIGTSAGGRGVVWTGGAS